MVIHVWKVVTIVVRDRNKKTMYSNQRLWHSQMFSKIHIPLAHVFPSLQNFFLFVYDSTEGFHFSHLSSSSTSIIFLGWVVFLVVSALSGLVVCFGKDYISALGDSGMRRDCPGVVFQAWNNYNEVGEEAPKMGSLTGPVRSSLSLSPSKNQNMACEQHYVSSNPWRNKLKKKCMVGRVIWCGLGRSCFGWL